MKAAFLKFVSPFLFVVFAATGTAVAATGSQLQGTNPQLQAQDGPVDCKATPEHPRCKDKK